MKKRNKALIAVAAMVAVPAAINYYIKNTFNEPFGSKEKQLEYSWRFGKIKYIKYGQGEPLLLLHGIGIGCAGHEWDSVITSLSRHYTLYIPDLIGFGNSDKPEISYSSYLYTSLINDFTKDVIGKPAFVAASNKAADFAVLSYRFKPDYIKKLLLVSPTGIDGNNDKTPYSGKFMNLPLYGTFMYNIMSSMAYTMYFLKKNAYFDRYKVSLNTGEKYFKSAHYGGPSAKYAISALLAGHLDCDISKTIKDVEAPIHIIWGADNTINPVNAVYDIKKSGFKFGLSVFENSRLLPHSECPSKFVKLCLEFFN